ncbi:Uncharacterised protein [Mycobacteroides abscessus subsp. abscessus]|nr:Uncharacterised protein [Mycobacteroides abscessus subsp. abscessus]
MSGFVHSATHTGQEPNCHGRDTPSAASLIIRRYVHTSRDQAVPTVNESAATWVRTPQQLVSRVLNRSGSGGDRDLTGRIRKHPHQIDCRIREDPSWLFNRVSDSLRTAPHISSRSEPYRKRVQTFRQIPIQKFTVSQVTNPDFHRARQRAAARRPVDLRPDRPRR